MKFEIIKTYQEFTQLKSQWNHLVNKRKKWNAFLSHGWFDDFINTFSLKDQLHIAVWKDKDRVLAILPLYVKNQKGLRTLFPYLALLANEHSCKIDLIQDGTLTPEEIQIQLSNLLKSTPYPLYLEDLPHDSKLNQALINNNQNPSLNRMLIRYQVRESVLLKLPESGEQFVKQSPRKTLKKYRNRLRGLNKKANLTFKKYDQIEDFKVIEEHINQIDSHSWQGQLGTGTLLSKQTGPFYANLMKRELTTHNLWVWILYADNEPIAYEIQIQDPYCLFGIKTAYKETYSVNSPGFILEFHHLHWAAENKFTQYDFLGYFTPYKYRWGGEQDLYFRFRLFPANPGSLVHYLLSRFRYQYYPRLKKFIKGKKLYT